MDKTFLKRYNEIKEQMTENKETNSTFLKLLLQLKDDLKEFLNNIGDEKDLAYQILLAHIYYDIGRLNANSNKSTEAETYWQECIELIKVRDIEREAITPYIGSLLNLGIITVDNTKALTLLTDAEKAYKGYKESGQYEDNKVKDTTQIDRFYNRITKNLARVYQNLGIFNMSAKYQYLTMKLSLESKSYISCDLAVLSANLSSFYIKSKNFKEARNYLAAADYLAYEFKIYSKSNEVHLVEKTFAYLGRRWGKYGIALLSASKEHLQQEEDDLASGINNIELDSEMPFLYTELPLKSYKKKISAEYCTTSKDAKKVFLFAKRWLEIAKDFYKPSDDLITYTDVMKDFAKLYDHITFFEKGWQNEFQMQEMRIQYNNELVAKLNPKTHMAICRECWNEAALGYSQQLLLKMRLILEDVDTSFRNHNDIDQLTECAIENFQKVVSSFKGDSSYCLSDMTFDEKKMCLNAHNKLAILYSKSINPFNPSTISTAVFYFKTFIEECSKEEEMRIEFKSDIEIAEEQMKSICSMFVF
ncbi:KIF-binding protein-like [Musca autumnalis]|uniref:KIF-binding protein-like n=1 Tax=Musca autumnalis TaxID=221902 RepID=UPI003CF64A74